MLKQELKLMPLRENATGLVELYVAGVVGDNTEDFIDEHLDWKQDWKSSFLQFQSRSKNKIAVKDIFYSWDFNLPQGVCLNTITFHVVFDTRDISKYLKYYVKHFCENTAMRGQTLDRYFNNAYAVHLKDIKVLRDTDVYAHWLNRLSSETKKLWEIRKKLIDHIPCYSCQGKNHTCVRCNGLGFEPIN